MKVGFGGLCSEWLVRAVFLKIEALRWIVFAVHETYRTSEQVIVSELIMNRNGPRILIYVTEEGILIQNTVPNNPLAVYA
jgi:hypothetical protein